MSSSHMAKIWRRRSSRSRAIAVCSDFRWSLFGGALNCADGIGRLPVELRRSDVRVLEFFVRDLGELLRLRLHGVPQVRALASRASSGAVPGDVRLPDVRVLD